MPSGLKQESTFCSASSLSCSCSRAALPSVRHPSSHALSLCSWRSKLLHSLCVSRSTLLLPTAKAALAAAMCAAALGAAAAACFFLLTGPEVSNACRVEAARASSAKAALEHDVLAGKPVGLGLPVNLAHASSS